MSREKMLNRYEEFDVPAGGSAEHPPAWLLTNSKPEDHHILAHPSAPEFNGPHILIDRQGNRRCCGHSSGCEWCAKGYPPSAPEAAAAKNALFPRCICGGVPVANASDDLTRTCIRCGAIVRPKVAAPIAPAAVSDLIQELRRGLAEAAMSLHTVAEQSGRDGDLRHSGRSQRDHAVRKTRTPQCGARW